jgi:hydrogenase maturation protease
MDKNILLIAYGNPDRQDDGVAWYILQKLAATYGQVVEDMNADFYETLGHNPDFFYTLQLTPELTDLIVKYDRVCFLDAHIGDEDGDVIFQHLTPHFEPSTLSHHMTPQFLLDITQSYHHVCPEAYLVSIRGYEFQFKRELSDQTAKLAKEAIQQIIRWYEE